jgi:pSer/pThr/pTyr-binding forkhead associated (FHA) protein
MLDKMKGVLEFKNLTIPRQPGELARFRALSGPDQGIVFVCTVPTVNIGRGEENELVITDLKASRKHLEIFINNGQVMARDLNSTHGFFVNGIHQVKSILRSGDKVGLGETVLEFIGTEAGAAQLIVQVPVIDKKIYLQEGASSSAVTQMIKSPKSQTFLERNRNLMIILGGLMIVATLLPSVEEKQKIKSNKYLEPAEVEAGGRALSSYLPRKTDAETKKNADLAFKEGFREYRAKNYMRALVGFETALQIDPDHALAKLYVNKTKQDMESEAKQEITDAKKDEEANRKPTALERYEAVKRLFAKDQSNPVYKEADTRSTELQKKLKEEGNNE